MQNTRPNFIEQQEQFMRIYPYHIVQLFRYYSADIQTIRTKWAQHNYVLLASTSMLQSYTYTYLSPFTTLVKLSIRSSQSPSAYTLRHNVVRLLCYPLEK